MTGTGDLVFFVVGTVWTKRSNFVDEIVSNLPQVSTRVRVRPICWEVEADSPHQTLDILEQWSDVPKGIFKPYL